MSNDFTKALIQIKKFFRRNNTSAFYVPSPQVTTDSWGKLAGVPLPQKYPVKVAINLTPTPEEQAVYGDDSTFLGRTRAILKVLSDDCCPTKGGSFEIPKLGQTWEVIDHKEHIRGDEVVWFNCLIGRH
jgi:hypothetical protein